LESPTSFGQRLIATLLFSTAIVTHILGPLLLELGRLFVVVLAMLLIEEPIETLSEEPETAAAPALA
jgi:hypothetical protein